MHGPPTSSTVLVNGESFNGFFTQLFIPNQVRNATAPGSKILNCQNSLPSANETPLWAKRHIFKAAEEAVFRTDQIKQDSL